MIGGRESLDIRVSLPKNPKKTKPQKLVFAPILFPNFLRLFAVFLRWIVVNALLDMRSETPTSVAFASALPPSPLMTTPGTWVGVLQSPEGKVGGVGAEGERAREGVVGHVAGNGKKPNKVAEDHKKWQKGKKPSATR